MFAHILRDIQRGTFEFGQLFAVQSAMPDFNKNNSVGGVFASPEQKGRNEKTDANRTAISGYFLEGGESGVKADWIFWNDDDTVFPDGAISHMLRLDKPFVAGLYFNTNPPYNPIAYKRIDNGGYQHLWDYAPGSVFEVDCVGMGCTLIHRSVYEKILEEYVVFQRPNASLIPIHKSKIFNNAEARAVMALGEKESVIDGYFVQQLVEPSVESNHLFPFYLMEHGRTEDMHFCELAASVGFKPWVDTSIVCEHWKHGAKTYEDYRQEFVKREIKPMEDFEI